MGWGAGLSSAQAAASPFRTKLHKALIMGKPTEEWILTPGDLLVKLHVKDFALNPSDPNGGGKFVNIREGSVRWPVVRQAIERVGYQGWMTIEGGKCSREEHSQRLDQIIAGQ